ncbi:MAG TPA: 3'-5' exonuclease [Burkholderiales bacterium]
MSWWRRTPLAQTRWVAIDCETSGLDPARDRLLSVGAVAVSAARIELSSALHSLVKQDAPSPASNILIHGIGGDAQRAGLPLAQVLQKLADYVGDAVPVGFHAPFDEQVLRRHGFRARQGWVDLAALAPVLFPGRKAKALDEWLAEFGIPAHQRHDALGDAFATAQLLLVALAEAQRQRADTVEALRAAGRAARWL